MVAATRQPIKKVTAPRHEMPAHVAYPRFEIEVRETQSPDPDAPKEHEMHFVLKSGYSLGFSETSRGLLLNVGYKGKPAHYALVRFKDSPDVAPMRINQEGICIVPKPIAGKTYALIVGGNVDEE